MGSIEGWKRKVRTNLCYCKKIAHDTWSTGASTINRYGRRGVHRVRADLGRGILQTHTMITPQNGLHIVGDIRDSPLNGHGHTTPEHPLVRDGNTPLLAPNNISYR